MKKREINLPMRFNPGMQKYEPDLLVKKSGKKIEFNWTIFLLILLGIIVGGILLYFLLI